LEVRGQSTALLTHMPLAHCIWFGGQLSHSGQAPIEHVPSEHVLTAHVCGATGSTAVEFRPHRKTLRLHVCLFAQSTGAS